MSLKEKLLSYIVEASKPNINPQNPHGYCYIEAGHDSLATELHNEELIQALVTSRNADGSFPVRPLQSAITWATAAKPDMGPQFGSGAAAPQAQTLPATHQPVQRTQGVGPAVPLKIETDVPIPEKKAFGRQSSGEDKVTKFGFANMPVNASFFVPETGSDPEKPIHRTFSSTVSAANKKLHPMNFVIREWTQPDGTKGARVWRTEDLQGERPTRTRSKPASAAPAPQPGAAAAGGWTLPAAAPAFSGGFGGSPGFGAPAPGGFAPQPGAAPQPSWGEAPSFGGGAPLPPFEG